MTNRSRVEQEALLVDAKDLDGVYFVDGVAYTRLDDMLKTQLHRVLDHKDVLIKHENQNLPDLIDSLIPSPTIRRRVRSILQRNNWERVEKEG